MMKRIRAILEGTNHAGLSRRVWLIAFLSYSALIWIRITVWNVFIIIISPQAPPVLVSELPFAAVRDLCTSFVLSGGGTPTLPPHLTYSTKHVKLLLEALTDSEREAKIDTRASRIIYIYSLPDSLIDIVTFSATN